MTEPLPDFDLAAFLPYRLSVAAQKVSDGLARVYREEFGLSVAEWRVLAHLVHAGEVSVREIERRANLEKSKASRAASRLEAAGFVTKRINTTDRRLIVLSLTDGGRDLMARLLPRAQSYQDDLARRIGPELDAFDVVLTRLEELPR